MILLCSPSAAQSPYVNEEVRLFKALGRADRIIPVIFEGEALMRSLDGRGKAGARERHALFAGLSAAGDAELVRGNRQVALGKYRAAQKIMQEVATAEPGNTHWQRELSVSHDRIGDVLLEVGKREEALASYRASLAIVERLAKNDPGNAGWQADLAASHGKLGTVLSSMGERQKAIEMLKKGRAILLPWRKRDPQNVLWINYMKSFDRLIANLEKG